MAPSGLPIVFVPLCMPETHSYNAIVSEKLLDGLDNGGLRFFFLGGGVIVGD